MNERLTDATTQEDQAHMAEVDRDAARAVVRIEWDMVDPQHHDLLEAIRELGNVMELMGDGR